MPLLTVFMLVNKLVLVLFCFVLLGTEFFVQNFVLFWGGFGCYLLFVGWGIFGFVLFEISRFGFGFFFNFCKIQTTLKCHEGSKKVHEQHGEEKTMSLNPDPIR